MPAACARLAAQRAFTGDTNDREVFGGRILFEPPNGGRKRHLRLEIARSASTSIGLVSSPLFHNFARVAIVCTGN